MFYRCVRSIIRYETILQIFVIFIWLSLLKLGIFTTSSVFQSSDISEKEEKFHKYSLTPRLKTNNQIPIDSVADDCFQRFKSLAPDKNQVVIQWEKMLPHMDLNSVKLVCSTLNEESVVLEWGCGGSTTFFSRYVANWVCVEHDPHWSRIVEKQLSSQTFRGKVEVNVVEVNEEYLPIFDDNTWNDGIYQEFRDYIEYPASLNKKFDVIIDDGRARVPAAISILRNQLLNKNGVLIIHDWERLEYRVVLKHGFEVVEEDKESNRQLAVLKPTV